MKSMIYLDNNATTMMPQSVIDKIVSHANMGNPSSGYKSARNASKIIATFRNKISSTCGFELANEYTTNNDAYRIIFTSGASESNVSIINMIVASYEKLSVIPHIITSSYEHKSILLMLRNLSQCGRITLTEISPTITSQGAIILPSDVEKNINKNTCLVTIMHSNNELGVINDINKICEICHRHNVVLHTDIVQTFARYPLPSADAYSLSFHKVQGPPGIGALIIRDKLICGYKLSAYISGTQNYGLRGGTENTPYIAASMEAFNITTTNRINKNIYVAGLKSHIIKRLSENFNAVFYDEYLHTRDFNNGIVFLSNIDNHLCGTILLSIVKKTPPMICNIKLRELLEKFNIIVGIGSACNTSSKKASHVLYSINADKFIRAGTLRISLYETNSADEINTFLDVFIKILKCNLKARS